VSPRNPAASRQRLIETAAALFYRRGIHRTSIDEVVAEAGLTKPTLYRHFGSKDALVAAVVEYRSICWSEAIEARISSARSPVRRIVAVFEFLEEFIAARNFRGCALVNASVEILDPSTAGRKCAQANKQRNRERLERLARNAGLTKPKALAASLSLLFEGAIVTAYVESDADAGRDARRAAERLIQLHKPAPSD